MDIYIGMSKTKLVEELTRVADEAREKVDRGDDYIAIEIYAESNDLGGGDVTLHFSNDDMERPEVADKVFVEVSE